MSRPAKVLIVDSSCLCYASHYGVGGLGTAEGPTGIIYGFFNQLQTICRALQVSHIAFCWDSKKSLRKRLFPGYKDRTKQKSDPVLQANLHQFRIIRDEIFPALRIKNSFMATGFEADDLIASICKYDPPQGNQQYIIASTDADLYQLLTDNISMYKFNKRELYTKHDFWKGYHIGPEDWARVKAIAGCTSDTVPGIKGVGEKTACKYLDGLLLTSNKIETSEGLVIIKRNLPLVRLPFKGTPEIKLDWSEFPSYAAWLEICEKYEFQSFLRTPKIWEQIWTFTAPSNIKDIVRIGKR